MAGRRWSGGFAAQFGEPSAHGDKGDFQPSMATSRTIDPKQYFLRGFATIFRRPITSPRALRRDLGALGRLSRE